MFYEINVSWDGDGKVEKCSKGRWKGNCWIGSDKQRGKKEEAGKHCVKSLGKEIQEFKTPLTYVGN